MSNLALLSVAGIAVIFGCAEPPVPDSGAIVVIGSSSSYGQLPELSIEDIGTACGVDEERCSKPGFQVAAVHPDGAIAFFGVDGRRSQLLRATSSGVVALGREGSGPGEYRTALALGIAETGEVLAADVVQRRVLRYDTGGRSLSTSSIPIPAGAFEFAFVGDSLRAFATAVKSASGDSLPVRVFALDTGSTRPRELFQLPVRQPAYRLTDLRPPPPLFAARTHFAFRRDGHLFVSTGASFVIDEYDATGKHVARFGFDVQPRAVTEAELEVVRRENMRRVSDPAMRQALEASMRSGATRHPAVTHLAPLENGSVWVREPPRESADSVQWIVFSAPMRPLGRITLAASETVLGSNGDRVLISRDGDDGSRTALRWVRVRSSQ